MRDFLTKFCQLEIQFQNSQMYFFCYVERGFENRLLSSRLVGVNGIGYTKVTSRSSELAYPLAEVTAPMVVLEIPSVKSNYQRETLGGKCDTDC
jgi:hypothetical protein